MLFISAATGAWAEEVPGWLRETATRQVPAYEAKVPAVVLLDETHAVVDDAGRITQSRRVAIKILNQEGRSEAHAAEIYLLGTAKIREMRAWMLSPSGELLKLGKEAEYDRAYLVGDMYNDVRERGVNAASKADPGGVFGFESVLEMRPLFAQTEWAFQGRLPTLVSRYVLTVPPGWRAKGVVSNRPNLQPQVDGSTYTWELKNLPFVEPEPASPRLQSLTPRLDLSYYPGPGAKGQPPLSFDSWAAVSRWLATLNDPAAEPDSAISAKTQELTAKATSDFQKIQTIGGFVQRIKYVSIQTGIGRGGGFKPHAAADVFTKDYGDCKDKAALMRAMLKAAGLTSYPVFVNANDRSYVREELPSPAQFNHVIVAVKLPGEIKADAALQHPSFGTLLFFDPTNGITPAGELPLVEQGGLGLIGAGEAGALVRLPMAPPADNLTAREIRAALTDTGRLTAIVREESRGTAAVADRQLFYSQARPDFERAIARWVARYATGAALSQLNASDAFYQGRFGMSYRLDAPGYGQMKAGRLMVFKPVLLGRRQGVFLTEPKRNYPVLLNPVSFREVIHVQLPPAFRLDELPDPEKLESPFGQYAAKCEIAAGELLCSRSWEVRAATIPPQQYEAVRDFYKKILSMEQSAVVLERKPPQ